MYHSKVKLYRVTIKEIDTFYVMQYPNRYRSGHTICIVAWRKDEFFFQGILSYFVSILAKSLIISFQYDIESVYFFYSNPVFDCIQLYQIQA
jgi:hypothetical protein